MGDIIWWVVVCAIEITIICYLGILGISAILAGITEIVDRIVKAFRGL